MGDNLGYGQHADYVFGWKGTALQRAMDASNPNSVLKTQSYNVANNCSIETTVKEEVSGCKFLRGEGLFAQGTDLAAV